MREKRYWWHTGNVYSYLATKLIWALLALLLTQLFFYLLNTHHFQIDGFGEAIGIVWGNIRFGLATLMLILLPWLVLNLLPFKMRWNGVYRFVSDVLYLVPSLAMLVVNQIDVAYFQFTYRRMSSEMFAYMGVGGQMGSLIPRFIVDYWPTTVSGLCIIFLFCLLSHKTAFPPKREFDHHHTNDLIGLAIGLLVAFVLMRGGFQRHWIGLNDSAKYCQMQNTPMVFNSPYNIIRTYGQPDLDVEELTFMSDEEARQLFDPLFVPLANEANTTQPIDYGYFKAGGGMTTYMGQDSIRYARQKNVVIFVLEGFAQEYLNFYNDSLDVCYAPFLDSLSHHSILFQGYSNGKKSIESIPAIMTSIPTLTDKPFTMTEYNGNEMYGLPQILKNHGYNTSFFHGSFNGVMGFDAFCYKVGFDAYYGQNEYPDQSKIDGCWGIYDEPYLQFTARQLSRCPEPFFSGIFTISSHHPYSIPEEHTGKFKQGEHPILETIGYVDHALRMFFEAASKEAWYENTIFLFMGDHPGPAISKEFNTPAGMYRIPMMVFDPQHPEGLRSDRVMQQADVMPTLIDYLGIDESCIVFGSSVFQQPEGFQVAYGSGYYQLINQSGVSLLELSHGKSYEVDSDGGILMLKAILQQYAQRMKNNQLTTKVLPQQKDDKDSQK